MVAGLASTLDPHLWQLRIDGQVEAKLALSLADLRSRSERRTLVATLRCAGNRRAGLIEVRAIPGEDPWGPGATSTAEWTGVSLADVLTAAGLRPTVAHLAFAAPDVSQLAHPPPAPALRQFHHGPEGPFRRGAAGLGDERLAVTQGARRPGPRGRSRLHRSP